MTLDQQYRLSKVTISKTADPREMLCMEHQKNNVLDFIIVLFLMRFNCKEHACMVLQQLFSVLWAFLLSLHEFIPMPIKS